MTVGDEAGLPRGRVRHTENGQAAELEIALFAPERQEALVVAEVLCQKLGPAEDLLPPGRQGGVPVRGVPTLAAKGEGILRLRDNLCPLRGNRLCTAQKDGMRHLVDYAKLPHQIQPAWSRRGEAL